MQWYSQYLYKFEDGEGYEKLIEILEHEDVEINDLYNVMKSFSIQMRK